MLVESWQEGEFENGKKDAELESEIQTSFSALGSLDEGAHSEFPRVPNSHGNFDKHYKLRRAFWRTVTGYLWSHLGGR
jgi:hypothetical protein